MVPLVGYLLEYSVAYTLDGDRQTNCLGGRELVVIEVWLGTADDPRAHLLLAFSCPSELLAPQGSLPFSLEQLVNRLRDKYTSRLLAALSEGGAVGWRQIEVQVQRVCQDRFAL